MPCMYNFGDFLGETSFERKEGDKNEYLHVNNVISKGPSYWLTIQFVDASGFTGIRNQESLYSPY